MTWSAESEASSQNVRGKQLARLLHQDLHDPPGARPGSGPVRLGRLADPGPGLVPFIGPTGQQGLPDQRVNGWQGQLQHRLLRTRAT